MVRASALLAAFGSTPETEDEYVRSMTGALAMAESMDDLRVIKSLLQSALTK